MLGKALQIAAGGNFSVVWPDISTGSFVRFEQTESSTLDKRGVFFKPDGTKFYVLDANDDITQYSLSTAWDVSSYTSSDHTIQTDQTNNTIPHGLFFSEDGTRMFTCQFATLTKGVCQYSLSTAWDISTASYVRVFDTSTQESNPYGVTFSPDGLNMFVVGDADKVIRYTLSTAWDISTASHTSTSIQMSVDSEYIIASLFLKPEGDRIYVLGQLRDKILQWNLATPYDSSEIDLTPDSTFSVGSQEGSGQSFYISPDGAHLYVGGGAGHGIDQYTLG